MRRERVAMAKNNTELVDDILSRCVPNRIVTPFVKQYGRLFQPQRLPPNYRRGAWKACFANSYRMALRHGFVYVEGYAISSDTGTGCLHSWCVDRQGMVLERTWGHPGNAYFGIPFQTQFLRRTIDARRRSLGDKVYFGLLDDYEARWPLIKHLGDSPELWLETLTRPKLRLVRPRTH